MSDDQHDAAADEPRLAPVDAKSAAEVHAELIGANEPDESQSARSRLQPLPPLRPPQYSLRDLFILVTIASVGLAGVKWMSPGTYAGYLGLATLLWLIVLLVLRPDAAILHVIWWGLFTTYLLATLVALLVQNAPAH